MILLIFLAVSELISSSVDINLLVRAEFYSRASRNLRIQIFHERELSNLTLATYPRCPDSNFWEIEITNNKRGIAACATFPFGSCGQFAFAQILQAQIARVGAIQPRPILSYVYDAVTFFSAVPEIRDRKLFITLYMIWSRMCQESRLKLTLCPARSSRYCREYVKNVLKCGLLCLVGFDLDETGAKKLKNFFLSDPLGILTPGHIPKARAHCGHDVCVFGYNPIEKYFLIANNWGTNFGDRGVFRVKEDALRWKYCAFVQPHDESSWVTEGLSKLIMHNIITRVNQSLDSAASAKSLAKEYVALLTKQRECCIWKRCCLLWSTHDGIDFLIFEKL